MLVVADVLIDSIRQEGSGGGIILVRRRGQVARIVESVGPGLVLSPLRAKGSQHIVKSCLW